MIDKALASVKKETDRQYFFSRLKNPMWIQPLTERGYFQSPPRARILPDENIQFPTWPELQYLKNVSEEVPNEVIELMLQLPEVDNPIIYQHILEIALRLHGRHSAKLLPKMLEYVNLEHQFSAHRYIDLLIHWTAEEQTQAALELSKELVKLTPANQSKDMQSRSKKRLENWSQQLNPMLSVDRSQYQKILENGLRPLMDRVPYQISNIFIDATTSMLGMLKTPKEFDEEVYEDRSEIWCRRLNQPNKGHDDVKATLVKALTLACEKVYENSPDKINVLDEKLRKQRWKVFKRLRQHLYSVHPNEQTLPWIREFILNNKNYSEGEHNLEFQVMIRKSCEYFGADFLTDKERTKIFDAILSGPSREKFREWMGDEFTNEKFIQRQHYFHRKQLRPFVSLLTGDYQKYYQELENTEKETFSDDDYSPFSGLKGGFVTYRSPRSLEDLARLGDEEMLEYLNEWEDRYRDKDDRLIEINIEALAKEYQTLFKDTIIYDEDRLAYWLGNRDLIRRPIYVKAIIQAIQEYVKELHFEQLDLWFGLCEWVLSHPDNDNKNDTKFSDESREYPDWQSSRRAVVDLLESCLEIDNFPFSARAWLAKLLTSLCTQFDRRLDCNEPFFLNGDDHLSEAININRSSALETFIKFSIWVRKQNDDDRVSEVTEVLDERIKAGAEFPLTMPEYAILGLYYIQLCNLNRSWALQHKAIFFPQDNISVWRETFGNFLRYNHPSNIAIEILREEYDFSLEHLDDLNKIKDHGLEIADNLGQHLFTYYLWQIYPLNGVDSLLEKFYKKTNRHKQLWANLFDHVGRSLRNSGKQLDEDLKNRVVDFFESRLEVKEPQELQEFTFWLEAECLSAEWRLNAYSRVLDVINSDDTGTYSAEYMILSDGLEALRNMLEEHTAQVVECFAKITDSGKKSSLIYVPLEEIKPILEVGIKSNDKIVKQNAERARENLLKMSRFDFLDLGDE